LLALGLGAAVRGLPRDARPGDAVGFGLAGVGVTPAVGEAVAVSVGVALAVMAITGESAAVGWETSRIAPTAPPITSATPTAAAETRPTLDRDVRALACFPATEPSFRATNEITGR
jgi:hypothetical protein